MIRESIANTLILALLGISAFVLYFLEQTYYVNLISRLVVFAIAGVGLNIALGFGGMVSLGHAAFFGVGGYIAGISSLHFIESTPWFWGFNGTNQMLLIWLTTTFISILLSLIIGLISLRTTGVYFIMITLAFAQMIYYFAISWDSYGGEDGLLMSNRNQLFSYDTDNELFFFAICFSLLLIFLFLSSRLIRSRFGTALQVSRMNHIRLATVGISPFPIKLVAFIVSAVITTIAGALFADLNRFVSPDMLSWQMSGEIIIFILLGGLGRLMGPVIGASIFALLETILGAYTEHWKLFLGVFLLLIVLFAKGGLMEIVAGRKRHD